MQNGILRQPSPVKITGPCCEIQIQSIVAFTAFKSLKTASLLNHFSELGIKMWRVKDLKTHLRNKEVNHLPNVEISRLTSLTAVKFHTRVPVCFRRESVKPNTENSLSALFVPFQRTFEGQDFLWCQSVFKCWVCRCLSCWALALTAGLKVLTASWRRAAALRDP